MAVVLLIDDDVRTLDVLDFSLTLDGHQIVRAVNGEDGLRAARSCRPDVIILDSMMPVMDGVATARALRSDPDLHDIRIVMLTARVTDDAVWEGWQAGVDSYVTKPLDVEVLHTELDRLGIAGGVPVEVQ